MTTPRKPKRKHWYSRRVGANAPSYLADPSFNKFSAWAEGWNACVEAYHRETAEALRQEGFRVEEVPPS